MKTEVLSLSLKMISSVAFRTSKIAKELKALATKPTVLSLNPGDHMEDERD